MTKAKTKKAPSVRLPRHILPVRYGITLKPDLESFTFSGEEVIDIVITKADTIVTLHASEMEIVTAEFIPAKGKSAPKKSKKKTVPPSSEIWSSKITYNEKAETVTLRFPKPIPKGKGKLKLVFRGVLNDKLRGYYRSSFTHNGITKHLATTQFEATDARRAFPCFDEPNIKAVFDVTLIVPTHHAAISNTLPAIVEEHEAGFKAVRFKPTPKMSTYLLAFVSGELDVIEKKTRSGVLVRVFTTPGKSKQAKFALDFGARALEFYEKYFQIKYPLPVLDFLAIPDFMSGAMENWGAITFRETQLLFDEEHSAAATKQRVAIVISHELAHQWFGNLVTMDWWTHLWLNEGFASYIEYLAVDHLYPEWNMWNQFMMLDYAAGMSKDQLVSTHPIEVEVHHPDEIDEIFDDISYRKGSSVIRMLASYLGEADFRSGLSYYLKKHAYKNATTDDLWLALEKISKKPVRKIMSAWTKQSGFPLVSAVQTEGMLELSQKRFFINPEAAKKHKNVKGLWPIPVSRQVTAKKVETLLLTTEKTQIVQEFPTKLNLGETGFFRVAYTPEMLESFAGPLERTEIPPLDRWGIVNNAWALAEAGELPTVSVLQLMLSLRKETDYTVLTQAIAGVLRLGSFYRTERWYKAYQAYVRFLLAPTIERLGWKKKAGEAHGDTLLRASCLLAFGRNGDEETVAQGIKEFTQIAKQGIGSVDPDIRAAVYGLVAYAGAVPEFEFLKRLYLETDHQEEKTRITRALCAFTTDALIDRALEFGFSPHVRASDSWFFCAFTGMRSEGHERNWKFIQKNWPTILERYGSGGHLLSRVVESLDDVSDMKTYAEVQKFFASNPHPGADRTLIQTLEHIHTASLWKERDREAVGKFVLKLAVQSRKA